MEALVIVLIEAIAAPLAALFGAMATLLGSALSSLFTLTLDAVMAYLAGACKRTKVQPTDEPTSATTTLGIPPSHSSSPHHQPPEQADSAEVTSSPTPPLSLRRKPRWIRWLTISALAITGLVLTILTTINLWFLDDVARYLLNKQRERTGITITAENISGNLFTGRFQAERITVQRHDHPAGLIDLTIQRMEAKVAVWNVLADPLVVETLIVDGVRGRFERGVPGQKPLNQPVDAGISLGTNGNRIEITLGENDQKKRKRPFIITSLTVTDLEVAYADHTRKRPLALPVTITKLTATPLRSQWAVFDVLFRANATGSIAGSPLRIITSGDDLGRDTQWHIDGLPVAVLADQIGGPFALLTSGTADVRVVDHWRMSNQERVIVMDWSLVLNQVKAEVPEDLSKVMALLAKPAVAFINAKGERVPLSFRVEIDENRFDGAASAEAAGLWEVVSDSAAATLAKALGIETDTVKEARDKLLNKAKGALDKWRKKE